MTSISTGHVPLILGRHRLPGHASTNDQPTALQWLEQIRKLGLTEAARSADGSFAVGVAETEGRIFLAVDRFAIETLCFRVSDGQLKFAERADDLAGNGPALDHQALFDYLYFHCIPSPRTIFRDVYRLPPGHCAIFDNGELRIERYWTPEFIERNEASFASLKEEFHAGLDAAVRRQLDGSKPACFLSGGTDSSTVAGVIGRVAGKPAATFSIGFDAAGYDEMAFARIAARHFGTEHHEYYVTPDDLVRSIGTVAAHYDQPFGNSSALPAFYCARFARDQGVTRLLAGDGGDELFGGNSRYAMQRVFGWYGKLPSFLREGVLEPIFPPGAYPGIPLLRKGAGYINQAKVPMPDRLQQYNLLHRLGVDRVLTPGFVEQIEVGDVLRQQREVWRTANAAAEINRTLAFDWRYTLAESDLPKVRGTTALAGISVGFPLLDQSLLDFSLRLPAAAKLKGLKLRWFFKEALRGFLPDEIITKRKQGFGLPFGVWATRHVALGNLVRDSLLSISTRGIVQPEFIGRLLRDLLPQHPGYYGEMVWILMILEHWIQKHVPQYHVDG